MTLLIFGISAFGPQTQAGTLQWPVVVYTPSLVSQMQTMLQQATDLFGFFGIPGKTDGVDNTTAIILGEFNSIKCPNLEHGCWVNKLMTLLNTQVAICGDGIVQPGEQCENTPPNTVDGDGCDHLCQNEAAHGTPYCGDGIIQPNDADQEQCDNGPPGSGTTPAGTILCKDPATKKIGWQDQNCTSCKLVASGVCNILGGGGGNSQWTTSGASIFYNTASGKVGIGAGFTSGNLPTAPLDVTGAIKATSLSATGNVTGGTVTSTNLLTAGSITVPSGSLKVTGAAAGLSKVLTSDASGNATWQTLPTVAVNDPCDSATDTGTRYQIEKKGTPLALCAQGYTCSTTTNKWVANPSCDAIGGGGGGGGGGANQDFEGVFGTDVDKTLSTNATNKDFTVDTKTAGGNFIVNSNNWSIDSTGKFCLGDPTVPANCTTTMPSGGSGGGGGSSQWTGAAGSPIYYTGGDVGIGAGFTATSLPSSALEVRGDVGVNPTNNYGFSLKTNVYPFKGYWNYTDDGSGYGPAWMHTNSVSGNTAPTMFLKTNGDGATLNVDSAAAFGDMTIASLGTAPAITTRTLISGGVNGNSYFNTGGNVGIGITNPGGKLQAVSSYADSVSTGFGIRSDITQTTTTNDSTKKYYTIGLRSGTTTLIDSTAKNYGYSMGIDSGVLRSDPADSGGLVGLYGQRIQIGHWTSAVAGSATARTTDSVFGLLISPYYQNGTITNLYGLYIGGSGTASNVTNLYGVYQMDANAKNYFAGKVGIGTNAPNSDLEVGSKSTGGSDIFVTNINSTTGNRINETVVSSPSSTEAYGRVAAIDVSGLYATPATPALPLPLILNQSKSGSTPVSGNVGIGTFTDAITGVFTPPSEKLEVRGNIKASVDGAGTGNVTADSMNSTGLLTAGSLKVNGAGATTNGNVLTTDGTGLASWKPITFAARAACNHTTDTSPHYQIQPQTTPLTGLCVQAYVCSSAAATLDTLITSGSCNAIGAGWTEVLTAPAHTTTTDLVGIGTNAPASNGTLEVADGTPDAVTGATGADVFVSNAGGASRQETIVSSPGINKPYGRVAAYDKGTGLPMDLILNHSTGTGGNVGIGQFLPATDFPLSDRLVVKGNVSASGDVNVGVMSGASHLCLNGNCQTDWPGLSNTGVKFWSQVGTTNDVYHSPGNVRIGSAVAPMVALDVTGAIKASTNITGGTITSTGLLTTGSLTVNGTGSTTVGNVLTSNGAGLAEWKTPTGGTDNLGDHTATQNINLNGNFIRGDAGTGTAKGLSVDSATGKVIIHDGNQQNHRVLTSDGTGLATWEDLPTANGGNPTLDTVYSNDGDKILNTGNGDLNINSGTGKFIVNRLCIGDPTISANCTTTMPTGGGPMDGPGGASTFEALYTADNDQQLLTPDNGPFEVNTGTGNFVVNSGNWSVDANGNLKAVHFCIGADCNIGENAQSLSLAFNRFVSAACAGPSDQDPPFCALTGETAIWNGVLEYFRNTISATNTRIDNLLPANVCGDGIPKSPNDQKPLPINEECDLGPANGGTVCSSTCQWVAATPPTPTCTDNISTFIPGTTAAGLKLVCPKGDRRLSECPGEPGFLTEACNQTCTGWAAVGPCRTPRTASFAEVVAKPATAPGGYAWANQACNDATTTLGYASHVCTMDEMLSIINGGGSGLPIEGQGWINGGPAGAPANDCNGWNTNDSQYLGMYWNFEAGKNYGSLNYCNNTTLGFACCKSE